MIIKIVSDIHHEFMGRSEYERFMHAYDGNDADVLVLAGDIIPLKYVDQIRDVLGAFCSRYKHVVYVPGNHEYYGTDVESARILLGAVQNEIHNLHVLKNSYLHLDGQRFYGGSLWFPDASDNHLYKSMLNDFRLIKGIEPYAYQQYVEFKKWGRQFIDENTVVVSHHLPSNKSVNKKFTNSQLNRFFVGPCDDLIEEFKPKLWIHGHTHDSCDYTVGKTRVICNPYGYNGLNFEYKNLILDV